MPSPFSVQLRRSARCVLAALALSFVFAGPLQAQMSDGYKFLDAVKKKDGQAVEEALASPGSTLIHSRDVTSGETALHIVTARRDLSWLRYLTAKGANINARDDKGQSPLQLATDLGWLEGVVFLAQSGADTNQPNDVGETPLISAVHRRNIGMVRALLNAGADPDRSDRSGRSARDYAKLPGTGSQILEAIAEKNESKTAPTSPAAVYGPTL